MTQISNAPSSVPRKDLHTTKTRSTLRVVCIIWTILQPLMSELFMGLFGIANIVSVDTKSEPVPEDSECPRFTYLLPILAKSPAKKVQVKEVVFCCLKSFFLECPEACLLNNFCLQHVRESEPNKFFNIACLSKCVPTTVSMRRLSEHDVKEYFLNSNRPKLCKHTDLQDIKVPAHC